MYVHCAMLSRNLLIFILTVIQTENSLSYTSVPPRKIAFLNVSGYPLESPNDPIAIRQGEESRVGCRAVASRPKASIKWYLDGASIEPNDVQHTQNAEDSSLTDTESWIVIRNPGRRDHGKMMTCEVLLLNGVEGSVNTTLKVLGGWRSFYLFTLLFVWSLYVLYKFIYQILIDIDFSVM